MKHVQPRTGAWGQVSISDDKRLFSLGFGAAEFIYHASIHGIIPVLSALCCFVQIKGPIQRKALHSVYHLGKDKLSERAFHRDLFTAEGSTESLGN